jgi:hypothetical protein
MEALRLPPKVLPLLFALFWIKEALFRYRKWWEILSDEGQKEPAPDVVFRRWSEDAKERGRSWEPIGEGVYEDFRIIAEMRQTLLPELRLR